MQTQSAKPDQKIRRFSGDPYTSKGSRRNGTAITKAGRYANGTL